MKKSLAGFIYFGLLFWLVAIIVLPFMNPWFFLLGIPMPFIMPHLDTIFLWCLGTMDGDSKKYFDKK